MIVLTHKRNRQVKEAALGRWAVAVALEEEDLVAEEEEPHLEGVVGLRLVLVI